MSLADSSAIGTIPDTVLRQLAERSPLAMLAIQSRFDPEAAFEGALSRVTAGDDRDDLELVVQSLLARDWSRARGNGRRLVSLVEAAPDTIGPAMLASVVQVALPDDASGPVRGLLDRALRRFVDQPDLLRVATELAIREGRPAEAHDLLTRLGLREAQGATVQAVYRKRAALPEATPPDVRIALLSSFTIDPLAAWIDLETRRLGLRAELFIAPFNTISLQLLDERSALYSSNPDIIFLSAALDDLAPELAGPLEPAALAALADRVVQDMAGYARAFSERSGATLVVHSFTSAFIGGPLVDWSPGGRGHWLRALNHRVIEACAAYSRVHVLDVESVAAARAGGSAEDAKWRYMAGMRLGDGLAAALARRYARYLIPLRGMTKKCLVLDLDNTLWGGIVGEDGPDGIRLGNTSPGVEYHDLQLAIASLSRRGVLLALNSKNNPEDALQVIRSHPWMALREGDFSAIRINWTSKVENLRSIAEELNIGVDSLVFLDDNPVECEQVRQLLPEVTTVQMPRDPSRYRATLEELPWFDAFAVTSEDAARVEQYRANRSRTAHLETTGSVDDYLQSLDIRISIRRVERATVPRVVQLLAKTNQFNLTTRRHTLADVEAWMSAAGWRVETVSAQDRFGDHGLVALAIVECGVEAWRVDTLLMSCRVIGQGIETALLAHVHAAAVAAGVTRLVGEFRPTKKNAQVSDFYQRHGFVETAAADDGSKTLTLALPATLSQPAWIECSSS